MPRTPLPAITVAVLLAVLLGGCGGGDPTAQSPAPPPHHGTSGRPETSAPQHHADRGRRPSAHPTVSPSPRPHRGRKTAPALPSGRTSADAHLLDQDTMPGLTEGGAWQVAGQGPEGEQAVGACQKTPLFSIGAVSATRRDFASADSAAHAVQVVGRFADSKSAWRAQQVLAAWREDCEQRLDYARRDVGPMRDVPVTTGIGASYRASYGPKPQARGVTAGLGIVRKGSYLCIVEIASPPAQWPAIGNPARAAVRRIARTFA